MVDADDPAIGRVDTATDPEKLSQREIEKELSQNPNLRGDAVRQFAEKVAERREAVLKDGQAVLAKRFQPNPANPDVLQVRNSKGQLAPAIDADSMDSVSTSVDGGKLSATYTSTKGERTTVELGKVDLGKREGASDVRGFNTRYARKTHPAQQRGGGR
jgi:hypothetical protein